MKPLNNPKALLEEIHRVRAMFWGRSDHPLTSLAAFLSGYKLAWIAGLDASIAPEALIPPGFDDYVATRLQNGNGSQLGWKEILLNNTKTEEDGFQMFFELLKGFADATSESSSTSNEK